MPDDSSEDLLLAEEEGLFARDIDGHLLRMDKVTAADLSIDVTIKIDGQDVTVKKAVPLTDTQGDIICDTEGRPIPRPTTIYDAASKLYVEQLGNQNPIPILCHQEHLEPVAVCRLCVVEIAKVKRGKVQRERKLLPACQHRVEETMEVQTIESPDPEARKRVRSAVRILTELLVADHLLGDPKLQPAYHELAALAHRVQVDTPRFSRRSSDRGSDQSSLVIHVDHNSCILCDRCVRACDDVKRNVVIGRIGKGYTTRIGFDLDQPMGESSCVSCGECMITCPTNALTFRSTVRDAQELPSSGVVPVDELKEYELFAGVPYKFLQWNSGSVVRRRVRRGDVLCREGEPGSTAFLLIRGRFEVSLKTPMKELKSTRGGRGLFSGRAKTVPVSSARAKEPSSREVSIRNDGGARLSSGHPIAIRTPEDVILGEMTCLNHYPRSATVTAMEEGEVLEINRNVLFVLQRNKASREILNKVYRERVLGDHLRSSSLIAALSDAQREQCIAYLRDRVDLLRVGRGQVIFRQGDRADHFYLVRLGFVKAVQTYSGQDRVLDYLGPGNSFGEIGLLSSFVEGVANLFPAGVPPRVRTATCTALDDVELVRVRGEDFQALLEWSPVIRDQMIERAKELLANDEASMHELNDSLGEFLDQGLFSAQKLLVLDLESCTRCDECTRACSDTHDGITRLIREGLRFDKFLVASSCRSCLDPYCLVGCPVDAIHRRKRDGSQASLEIVIEDYCIGCGLCARNCPYGNINMHGFVEDWTSPDGQRTKVRAQKATTCDLCRDVVSANRDPSCVYACPHNAAFRMSGQELFQIVTRPQT